MIFRDFGTFVGSAAELPRRYTEHDFYRDAHQTRRFADFIEKPLDRPRRLVRHRSEAGVDY